MPLHPLAPPATTDTLRELGVTDHPDLVAYLSRDADWLEHETSEGFPADWCLEWTDTVHVETGYAERNLDNGPDTIESHEPRYAFGTFDMLAEALQKVIDRPERTIDAPIELDISEWAVRYRRQAAA